jgi:integrase
VSVEADSTDETELDGPSTSTKKKPKKLNIANLRNAYGKKRDKREIFWGKDGLYAEALPSGKITFRYRYRLPGSDKREKVTLGSFPALTLQQANKLHAEKRTQVVLGKSPAEAKSAAKTKATRVFSDLATEWVENVLKPANKNSRQDETYLRRDILPFIGNRDPKNIEKSSLWVCIENVRAKGYTQAARRVQSVLKRVFDYGFSKGYVAVNPVTGIDPSHVAPARSRDRVLSREEIPIWLRAVETSRLPRQTKLALHVLLFIPVRKGELLAARWVHINFAEGIWDIPKENSKNGAPIRHRLSKKALVIFEELHRLAAGSPWVMPSTRKGGEIPLSKSGINTALRTVNGLPKGVVIHDLRRTVRTYLSDLGVPTNVAELCLNHRPTGIKKIYDRAELLDQRHMALLKWERYIETLLSAGNSQQKSASSSELDALISKIRDDDYLRSYVIQQLLAGT